MMKSHNITEAEWPIMRVLWTNGSATAAEIVDAVTGERDVAMRTVKTLLRRLIAKKAVAYAIDPEDSRIYHYRAVIKKDEATRTKNRNFLASFYQNNIGELLTHFVNDASLTDREIAELQTTLDEIKRSRDKK
jgi:BlaI family penicillinase repressor